MDHKDMRRIGIMIISPLPADPDSIQQHNSHNITQIIQFKQENDSLFHIPELISLESTDVTHRSWALPFVLLLKMKHRQSMNDPRVYIRRKGTILSCHDCDDDDGTHADPRVIRWWEIFHAFIRPSPLNFILASSWHDDRQWSPLPSVPLHPSPILTIWRSHDSLNSVHIFCLHSRSISWKRNHWPLFLILVNSLHPASCHFMSRRLLFCMIVFDSISCKSFFFSFRLSLYWILCRIFFFRGSGRVEAHFLSISGSLPLTVSSVLGSSPHLWFSLSLFIFSYSAQRLWRVLVIRSFSFDIQ